MHIKCKQSILYHLLLDPSVIFPGQIALVTTPLSLFVNSIVKRSWDEQHRHGSYKLIDCRYLPDPKVVMCTRHIFNNSLLGRLKPRYHMRQCFQVLSTVIFLQTQITSFAFCQFHCQEKLG